MNGGAVISPSAKQQNAARKGWQTRKSIKTDEMGRGGRTCVNGAKLDRRERNAELKSWQISEPEFPS